MTISFMRYGAHWLARPGVMVLLLLAALIFLNPLFKLVRRGGMPRLKPSGTMQLKLEDFTYLFFIGVGIVMLATAQGWLFMARIGPTVVASILVVAATLSLANKVFVAAPLAGAAHAGGIHMDVASSTDGDLANRTVLLRAGKFFGWFLAFLACMSLIGMIPTVPLMIVAFMRIEGRESWRLSLILALCVTGLLYVIFQQIIHIPWPSSVLGQWFPMLAVGGA